MAERDPKQRLGIRVGGQAGFTLLEVLIAVAILAVVLTSMMGSQINSMQATRYARDVTAAALLAEYQIVEIEFESRKEGWVNSDVELEGDFSDQGYDDMKWACTIHFIELPEYNQLLNAKEESDEAAGDEDNIVDAGDQAFGALGMVWPYVKAAIENSIRKVDCKVTWKQGKDVEQEFTIQTFWTDPAALLQLPSDGEFTDEDDNSSDGQDGGSSTGGSGAGGRPPSLGGGSGGGMNMGTRPGG